MKTLKTKKNVWSALAVCLCAVIGVLSLSFLSACREKDDIWKDEDVGIYYTADGVAYTYDLIYFNNADCMPNYISVYIPSFITPQGSSDYDSLLRCFDFLGEDVWTSCLHLGGGISYLCVDLEYDSYVYFYCIASDKSPDFVSLGITDMDQGYLWPPTYYDTLDVEEGFLSFYLPAGSYWVWGDTSTGSRYYYLSLMVVVSLI